MSCCPVPPIPKRTPRYVNTEGRVQLGRRAVFPPGDAREDWAILRALSGALGQAAAVRFARRAARALRAAHPTFAEIDEIAAGRLGRLRHGGRRRSMARRSPIRSAISIAPIRSAAPRRRWRNAASLRGAEADARRPARMADFSHQPIGLPTALHRRARSCWSSCRCCWRSPIYT